MTARTLLHLDLARLPEPDFSDVAWYALTLSASLEDVAAAVNPRELLLPWTWANVNLKLFTKDQVDGSWATIYPTELITAELDGPSNSKPQLARLKDELSQTLDRLLGSASGQTRLVHDPNAAIPDERMPVDNRWSHLLLQVSRLMAPVGQNLRLVWLFKLDKNALAGKSHLVAAPEFDAGGNHWTPLPDKLDVATTRPLVEIVYNESELSSYGLALSTIRPAPDLWRKPSCGGKAWMPQLPLETAAASDLAMRLADSLGRIPDRLLTASEASWVRLATLVALRFSMHSGWVKELSDRVQQFEAERRRPRERLAVGIADEMQWPSLTLKEKFLTAVNDYEDAHRLTAIPNTGSLNEPWVKWSEQLRALLREQSPEWLTPAEGSTNPLKLFEPAVKSVPLREEVQTLRRLIGALREPANGASLVVAHWAAAIEEFADPADRPDLKAWLNEGKVELLGALASKSLSTRLTLDQLDAMWIKMTTSSGAVADEITGMRTAFQAELEALATGFLAGAGPAPELWELARINLFADAAVLAGLLGPELSKGDGRETETQTAQPLVVTVAGTRTAVDSGPVEEDGGESSRLAGLGVLLRRQSSTDALGKAKFADWYCVNMGRLEMTSADEARVESVLLDLGMAPWPVGESGGLESWTISYDNHPVTSRSLINAITNGSGTFNFESTNGHQGDDPVSLHVRSSQVERDGARKLTRLPVLAFGNRYEVATFGVTNAGAVPTELWDGSPLTLKLPQGDLPSSTIVSYLRRTPVAAPRTVDAVSSTNAMKLPRIPRDAGVYPLADDLLRSDNQEELDHAAAEAGPILLLLPQPIADKDPWLRNQGVKSEFHFAVRPPAVDSNVWHRWIANDGAQWPVRRVASVLGAFYENAPRPDKEGRSDVAKQVDLSFDDPAVTGMLLRLQRLSLGANGKLAVSLDREHLIRLEDAPTALEGFKSVQRNPISVQVTSSTQTRIDAPNLWGWTPPNPVVIQLDTAGAQNVWRLELKSLVEARRYMGAKPPNGDAVARLGKPDAKAEHLNVDGTEWVAAATQAFSIEIPKRTMPDERELWESIRVLGHRGNELCLGIDPLAVRGFDQVKEVTLETQQWRWNGRRLTRHFPFDKVAAWSGEIWAQQESGNDAWKDIVKWDGSGFGDRSDSDRRVRHGLLPGPAWLSIPASDNLALARGVSVHSIDLAAEPRALYLRNRAVAKSRYFGLLSNEGRKKGTVRCGWRRLIVRNRRSQQLPRPKVRFILPLTQPVDRPNPGEAKGVSSLIVMLDGSWSGIAGLAERLSCELMDTNYTGAPNPEGIPSAWPEYGDDPVESGDATLAMRNAGGGPAIPIQLDTSRTPLFSTDEPPFGLTFDLDVSAANPATSCFEIAIRDPKGVVRPGAFAKIRFRAGVDAKGSIQDPAGIPVTPPSEWTDGYWVQMLPDFSQWRVDGRADAVSTEVLRLGKDGRIIEGRLAKESEPTTWTPLRAIRLLPNTPSLVHGQMGGESKVRRTLLLLLTRVIHDVEGSKTSEIPLGLGRYEGTVDPVWQNGIRMEANLRVRLIEIEHHELGDLDGAETEESALRLFRKSATLEKQGLWTALFSKDDALPDHKRARIVRISPPIEMTK